MSAPGTNNPFAEVDDLAERLRALAGAAIDAGEADLVSDEAVRRLMTAAVKLYAAKADGGNRSFRALEGRYDEVVTPTEALTAATEILRAVRLGPMEFGLWSRRRPEDDHLRDDEAAGD
jgi:hypothetical protein